MQPCSRGKPLAVRPVQARSTRPRALSASPSAWSVGESSRSPAALLTLPLSSWAAPLVFRLARPPVFCTAPSVSRVSSPVSLPSPCLTPPRTSSFLPAMIDPSCQRSRRGDHPPTPATHWLLKARCVPLATHLAVSLV